MTGNRHMRERISLGSKRPTCPRCHVGGYKIGTAPDGRPAFTCTACDNHWTYGASGGPYLPVPRIAARGSTRKAGR